MYADIDQIIYRPVQVVDIPSIVGIDSSYFGTERSVYIAAKVTTALSTEHKMVASLVAEYQEQVIGFIMGSVHLGEFGIPDKTATIDTIGISPEFTGQGIASQLFQESLKNLRRLGIETVQTQVSWNDWRLLKFFEQQGFLPSRILSLERSVS